MSLAVRYADGRDSRVNMVARLDVYGVVDHYGRAVPPRSVYASRAIELPAANIDAFARLVSPGLLDQQYPFFVLLCFLLKFLDAAFRIEASHVNGTIF